MEGKNLKKIVLLGVTLVTVYLIFNYPLGWSGSDDIYGIHMQLEDGFTKTYYFSSEHEIHQEWQTGDALKVKWAMVKPFVYRIKNVENISLKQLR